MVPVQVSSSAGLDWASAAWGGGRGVVGEGVRVAFRGLRFGCLLGPAEL